MLKQVFDKEQVAKIISSSDVWQWNMLANYGDVEGAIDHIIECWGMDDITLSSLEVNVVKGRPVFTPSKMEDAFAIKLVDRFVRRIYKVRQSDRNRIVRQLKVLLQDSSDCHIIRLDIKQCYESINFQTLLDKFDSDQILAPQCMRLLHQIYHELSTNHGTLGLPRGLSISPTLAELYLEGLDSKIASHNDVIYSARYVDDIVVIVPKNKKEEVEADLEEYFDSMGLVINPDAGKGYSGPTRTASLDYLGYSIKVNPARNKKNKVDLTISQSKIDKIKSRIAISLSDFKKGKDFLLLKRRIEYLCMLKRVKKGKNGDLLAGVAHNYQYVTDEFECLKPIDGFLCQQISKHRFGLSQQQQIIIRKISIYGNVKKRSIGNFSKKKAAKIMRVWRNA